MLLMPEPSTALFDPVLDVSTLSQVCECVTRSPEKTMHVTKPAKKAEAYLKSAGIADAKSKINYSSRHRVIAIIET